MFHTKYSGWSVVTVLLTKHYLSTKKKANETVGARETYGVSGRI